MIKKKCIILLPTAYNDGSSIPFGVVQDILKEIDRDFDGHSIDGYVDGTYRMDDGSLVSDRSIKVWVAVDPDRVADLKALAARAASVLKQESIYFEVTQAEVEFVRPLPEIGERS
jgi:hypothetical protein